MKKMLKLLALSLAALGLVFTALLYIFPAPITHKIVAAERAMSGLSKKEIKLDNGLQMVYLEGGTGEPLLLLHGFSANKDNFTRVAKHLTPHYRVIIPDQIGFGESAKPADADYRSDAQVARLHELMAKLGISKVHVGGSSMGGFFAMVYALTYPDSVQSLWLLDPGGVISAQKTAIFEQYVKTGVHPLLASSNEDFAKVMKTSMHKPPFIPKVVRDEFAKEPIANHALFTTIFNQIVSENKEAELASIKTPTLIVWGEQDQLLSPKAAFALNKYIAGSQLIVMPNIGHLPMIEDVRQSAKDYLRFRSELVNNGAASK